VAGRSGRKEAFVVRLAISYECEATKQKFLIILSSGFL
jgi:hypothetical protein